MSDKDNITLPREAVEKIHEAWSSEVYPPATSTEWYDIMDALRTALAAEPTKPHPLIPLHQSDCALLIGGYQCTCGFRQRQNKTPTALAAKQEKKTPAWWMDGLAATLMREGVNKHRAREIAVGYWEAYCQIPGNKEDET